MRNGLVFWIALQLLLLYYGFTRHDWIYVILILGIFISGLFAHYKYNLFSNPNKKQFNCNHKTIVTNSKGQRICMECGKIIEDIN